MEDSRHAIGTKFDVDLDASGTLKAAILTFLGAPKSLTSRSEYILGLP